MKSCYRTLETQVDTNIETSDKIAFFLDKCPFESPFAFFEH